MFHLIRRGRADIRLLTKESFAVQIDAAGKTFVYQVLDELEKKTTGETINQMILQGKDVFTKELRVPTVP